LDWRLSLTAGRKRFLTPATQRKDDLEIFKRFSVCTSSSRSTRKNAEFFLESSFPDLCGDVLSAIDISVAVVLGVIMERM
jgi:hypothetical protein